MRNLFACAAMAAIIMLLAPGAFAQGHSTYLHWVPSATAASHPSLTYNVYRAPSCSGPFTKLNTKPVTATSYLDNQPPAGSYCYRVTAVVSGVESKPSNVATATILPPQPKP